MFRETNVNYTKISAYIAEDDKSLLVRFAKGTGRNLGWCICEGVKMFMEANNLLSKETRNERRNKKKTGQTTEDPTKSPASRHTWRKSDNVQNPRP